MHSVATEAAPTLTCADLVVLFREDCASDPWGNTMHWLFAIADALHWHHARPELIPDVWEFRPSIFWADPTEEYATCCNADPIELAKFGAKLWRLREILKTQGRDY
jgi:hypothetical protein